MKIIYKFIFCVLVLSGCYDEKGNYDCVEKENPVNISFSENMYNAIMGEPLLIVPTLEYSNDKDTTGFSFEWYIGNELYSEERNFVFYGSKIEDLSGFLCVTEDRTGLKTQADFAIKVTSLFATSWVVLAEENGMSMLHAVVNKQVDGEYKYVDYKDVYSGRAGEPLGSQPVKLVCHAPEILVIQHGDRGSVELDGYDFTPVVYLNEEFIGDQVPDNFYPIDALYTRFVNIILNRDGNIFMRYSGVAEHIYPYNNQATLIDASKEARAGSFIMPRGGFSSEQHLIHDNVNNRFMCFSSYSTFSGGAYQVIPDNGFAYPDDYIKLSDFGDMEFMFGIGLMPGNGMLYLTVFRDPNTGKLYCQRFNLHINQSTDVFTLYVADNQKKFEMLLGDAVVTDKTQFVHYYMYDYMFFTGGENNDKLYFYNTGSSNLEANLVHDFQGVEIIAIRTQNLYYPCDELGIALANGDVIVIDTPYNYHTNVLYTEKFKFNFGKVVDICHKPYYFQ